MVRTLSIGLWLASAGALGGCSMPPQKPPGAPPTPVTVTRSNPGGDAADPERAALERLAKEGWANRSDRWRTLTVPLMDEKNWRRVTMWGHPTRASFRYGDEHWAVVTIWYTPTEGPNDPDSCLTRFIDEAMPVAKAFDVTLGESKLVRTSQVVGRDTKPIAIRVVDGHIDSILKIGDYVGAVAAYQSWPGTCLVEGFAVVAGDHRELAVQIRDRWVEEGAPKLVWDRKVKQAPPTLSK